VGLVQGSDVNGIIEYNLMRAHPEKQKVLRIQNILPLYKDRGPDGKWLHIMSVKAFCAHL
jgi:hypothetical protein